MKRRAASAKIPAMISPAIKNQRLVFIDFNISSLDCKMVFERAFVDEFINEFNSTEELFMP